VDLALLQTIQIQLKIGSGNLLANSDEIEVVVINSGPEVFAQPFTPHRNTCDTLNSRTVCIQRKLDTCSYQAAPSRTCHLAF